MYQYSKWMWTLLLCPCLVALGCNSGDDYSDYGKSEKNAPNDENADVHGPHEHGPHDGHVIELGEHEYHAEMVFNEETRKITFYILGHEVDDSNPIEQTEITLNLKVGDEPQQFKLAAVPQEDDPEGKSSRFELAGDQLPEAIEDEEDLEGSIDITIGQKSYSGAIEHDHDH